MVGVCFEDHASTWSMCGLRIASQPVSNFDRKIKVFSSAEFLEARAELRERASVATGF